MNKVKAKVTEVASTTKTVTLNISEFVNALCLAAVTAAGFVTALDNRQELWAKGLFVASAVVAIQAFGLFIKHFNVKR